MSSARTATVAVLCAVVSLAAAVPAMAQVSTGRIDVTIADGTGAVLPGVAAAVSGPESHSTTTDSLGEAHFLNLAPGTYTLTAKATGFNDYLNRNVMVATGGSVALNISMIVAGVATQVQVSSESPVVDVAKMTTSTNVRLDELQNIPSARDPWGVLQTVPGIVLDRVNVGGSESGQQPGYQAKGGTAADNTWNIDGIAVTDMAAIGSSPTYYDFDMFQEMQVTTGGADVTASTPGVQLNMVLKSGSNTPHGSTRFYFENESMQANNMPADLAASIGGTSGKGNRMDQYMDYGIELGGPLVKNTLWAWGAAGKTHVDVLTLTGDHDRTELQDTSFKATARASKDLRVNFTYFRGDKDKFGRGASATHPPPATYDQSGPTPLYKGEVNLVLGGTSFLSARAARSTGGFSLTAEGGSERNWIVNDGGVFESTIDTYVTSRPQSNVALDGNTFRGHHELKYGLGWRKAEVASTDAYPGNGILSYHIGYPEILALVTRDWAESADAQYTSGYLADTWTTDRVTATAGVRWDRQAASLGSASVAASKALPSLLPALSAAPVENAIVWNSLMPRAGVTYVLGNERKSVLRGTYAMFASQMASGEADIISPIQNVGIYYEALDLGRQRITPQSRQPWLLRLRSEQPGPAGQRQPDWQLHDPADPGGPDRRRPRADGELRVERDVHLPLLRPVRLALGEPHRSECVELQADRHAQRHG
jgi:hypothetical protein